MLYRGGRGVDHYLYLTENFVERVHCLFDLSRSIRPREHVEQPGSALCDSLGHRVLFFVVDLSTIAGLGPRRALSVAYFVSNYSLLRQRAGLPGCAP